jgi:hypothetical protein
VLYVKFYMFSFHLVNANLMFIKMLVVRIRNVLRLVFVDWNVILRTVLQTRHESFHIRGTWNVKDTHIFFLVL